MPLVGSRSRGAVDATVFIPTFNGEKYLGRLLTAVESQEFTGNFEILIIDSGSTDRTLQIIAEHPAVRLVQIPKADFGHGKTRNQAAELARGTNIAYLSHDAIPVGRGWLAALMEPLNPAGLDCQGVLGKHIARPNCFPSLKYGIASVFRGCGADDRVTVVDGASVDFAELPASQKFYSDVCSATRRSFLLDQIPYRDLDYSEDMAFAEDLLKAGFRKAYQPAAVVEHSNDVTLGEYPKRMFDETLGMRKVSSSSVKLTGLGAVLRASKEILISEFKIIRDSDYALPAKIRWLFHNPFFVIARWRGIHRGLHVNLNDSQAIARHSLEAARK